MIVCFVRPATEREWERRCADVVALHARRAQEEHAKEETQAAAEEAAN